MPAQQVSKIACVNDGLFVLKFRSIAPNNPNSALTDDIIITGFGVVDLDLVRNLHDGTNVSIEVQAEEGATKRTHDHVQYKRGAPAIATYVVRGTTLDYSVTLIQ